MPAFLPTGSRLANRVLCRDRGCLHLPSTRGSRIRREPRSKKTLSPSWRGPMMGFAGLLLSPPQNPTLGSEDGWGNVCPPAAPAPMSRPMVVPPSSSQLMSFWGLVYAAVNERMRLQLGQGWGYKAGRFAGGVCSGCGFSACLLLPFFKVVKGWLPYLVLLLIRA